jgi:hypothetical protein
VVIDRFEQDGKFTREVAGAFKAAGLREPEVHKLHGYLDNDEQKEEMGRLLTELGYPRMRFFRSGDPTVFFFVIAKGDETSCAVRRPCWQPLNRVQITALPPDWVA